MTWKQKQLWFKSCDVLSSSKAIWKLLSEAENKEWQMKIKMYPFCLWYSCYKIVIYSRLEDLDIGKLGWFNYSSPVKSSPDKAMQIVILVKLRTSDGTFTHLPCYCLPYVWYASTEYCGSFMKKQSKTKMTTLSIYFQRCMQIFDPYFLVNELNTEIYSVNLHLQSECRKIGTRKNPVFRFSDIFYAVTAIPLAICKICNIVYS